MWDIVDTKEQKLLPELVASTGRAVRSELGQEHPCMALWGLGLCELLGGGINVHRATSKDAAMASAASLEAESAIVRTSSRFPALSPIFFLSMLPRRKGMVLAGLGQARERDLL